MVLVTINIKINYDIQLSQLNMVVSKLIVIENEMRKGEIQMSEKLCVLRYQITEDEFLKDYNATSLNEMVEALVNCIVDI